MKRTVSMLLVAVLVTSGLVAQDLTTFQNNLSGFLTEVTDALPDSAVVGGTWSDAYIGQLIGVPPHFGIGVAAGVTRFPIASLKSAIAASGMELPIDTLILPNIAVEARIGGFILPFDAGVRFGMIPSTPIPGADVTIEYLNIGADVRYALLKENLALPDLSIGLGYSYTSGQIGYTFDAGALANIDSSQFGLNTEGKLTTEFSASVIEAKLQVSKSLLLITPYAGLGLYTAVSNAEYAVSTALSGSSIGDSITANSFGARVFGGLSFNILVLKLDLTGMYNVMSENWGVNFGTRIQL